MTRRMIGKGKVVACLLVIGAVVCSSGCWMMSNAEGRLSDRNYQVNSGFEYATNPDIPDFWSQSTVMGGAPNATTKGYAEFHDKWRLDSSQAYEGKQSLSLERPFQLVGSEMPIPLPRQEPIVASVYLKAARPGTLVQIGLGERLDCNRGQACASSEVEVGTSWERHQVKLAKRKADLHYFFVAPKSEGRVWVDAVQIEAGESPSPYAPSQRDAVFDAPFFPERQAASITSAQDLSGRTPMGKPILELDFHDGEIPAACPCSPKDWEARDGALCRINCDGNSSVSFGQDTWDVGAIELKFRLLKAHDPKVDSMLYLDYRGGTIRATFTGNVVWIDGTLYAKDKKAGIIIAKKQLDPAAWHTLKVVYENNKPTVYLDGEYALTGGPCSKGGGKVTIGCWMIAAALDDLKIYTADPQERPNARNYQFNCGFETATTPGVPDFWFQTALRGGVELWAGDQGYAEFHGQWHVDASEAYEGRQSLALEKPFQLVGAELRLPHDKPIVASVWLKAARPGTLVRLGLEGQTDANAVSSEVEVGTEWGRYQVKRPGGSGFARLTVAPQSAGRVWVDATQVEIGDSPTPYIPSRGMPSPPMVSYTQSLLRDYKPPPPARPPLEAFTEYSYYTGEEEAQLVLELKLPGKTAGAYALTNVVSHKGEPVLELSNELRQTSGRMFVKLPLAKLGATGSPYGIKVTALDGGAPIAAAETGLVVLPPAKTEVKVNRLNRGLYVNGEPFIPYATFQGIPSQRQDCADQIAFMKASGMNTLFFPGYWASDDAVDACLDEAAAQGMRAFVFYDMAPRRNHDGHKIFSRLKGKQAVIGIDVADEIPNSEWAHDAIQLGKEIDPHVLLFLNHNVLGLHSFESQPKKTPGDLYSIDCYPISPSLARIGPTEDLYALETVMRMLDDASAPRRMPMNYWTQSGWAYNRGITPVEVEWLNYLPLIYGARSFAYYIGVPQSEVLWKRIGEIGREIETLKPALFSLESDPDIQPADSVTQEQVKFIAKKHAGKVYLIAVNRRMEAVDAVFDLSKVVKPGALEAEVLFEGRRIRITNGKLEDRFEPLRRHVYTFDR